MTDGLPLPRLTAEQEAAIADLLASPLPELPPRPPPPTHEPALRLPDPRLWTPPVRLRVRCTAHRSDGAPCRAWAIRGGRVCAAHGGRAPQVRAAARRRLESAALTAYLYRRIPPVPLGAAPRVAWAASVLGGDVERMAWADLVLGRDQ